MLILRIVCLSFIALTTVLLVGYFSLLSTDNAQKAFAVCVNDLTGKWNADDSGTYYIKENNRHVWWAGGSGFNAGTGFTNVFEGNRDDVSINGVWADVPIGNARGDGELSLQCDQDANNDKLTKTSSSWGFGGNVWTKPKEILKWSTVWSNKDDGDCHLVTAYLNLFSNGNGAWHADVISDSDGDSWVVKKITIVDATGKPIFVIPKFSSPTLSQGPALFATGPGPEEDKNRVWNNYNIHFPFEIFNSIAHATMEYSC